VQLHVLQIVESESACELARLPSLLQLLERPAPRLRDKGANEGGRQEGDARIEGKQIGRAQDGLHIGIDLQHHKGQDHAEKDGYAGGTASRPLREHLGDHEEGQREHAHGGEHDVGHDAGHRQPVPGAQGVGEPVATGQEQHAEAHAGGREDPRGLATPLLEDAAHEERGDDPGYAQHHGHQDGIDGNARLLGNLDRIDNDHHHAAGLLETKEGGHHEDGLVDLRAVDHLAEGLAGGGGVARVRQLLHVRQLRLEFGYVVHL